MPLPKYEEKTDNTYLPNTPEDWGAFRWYLHFYNARAVLVWSYFIKKETEHRNKNNDKSQKCDQNFKAV